MTSNKKDVNATNTNAPHKMTNSSTVDNSSLTTWNAIWWGLLDAYVDLVIKHQCRQLDL